MGQSYSYTVKAKDANQSRVFRTTGRQASIEAIDGEVIEHFRCETAQAAQTIVFGRAARLQFDLEQRGEVS